MIPATSREALLNALQDFDTHLRATPEWNDWENHETHRYAIEFNGRRYPVKKIISIATGTPVSEFSGGLEANGFIKQYGFEVVPLRPEGTRVLNVSMPKAHWIFQANPKFYDIDKALTELKEMTWLVSSHKHEIAPNDEVFIWKSGEEGGIFAKATVLSAPDLIEDTEAGKKFVVNEGDEKFSGDQLRVRLRIDSVLEEPLGRAALKAHPGLNELSILRFSQGTNFSVTAEQARILDQLIAAGPVDLEDLSASKKAGQTPDDSRVWAYSPGRRAQYWEEFYRDEMMAIGWEVLGDLSQYPTDESVAAALIKEWSLENTYPINDARACFDFAHVIKPGDRIVAKRGRDEVVGYGVVTGDYEFRPDRTVFPNVRKVRWERRGNWKCAEPIFAVKTLTDLSRFPDTIRYISELIGLAESSAAPPVQSAQPYGVDNALSGVAFEKTDFEDILSIWGTKKNLILQGPPGVGKTFLARKLAYSLLGYELPSHVEMVQFHQSYSYEDFVQGYRPSSSGFARKDGLFVRFCKRASLDQDSKYVFIIDEINRSNLSKVFGELLMLIEADKRGSKNSLALAYSTSEEEQFYVPENVFMLGLMNTADRSLALVDYALRRRFAFVELEPMFESATFANFLRSTGTAAGLTVAVCERLCLLNQAITKDQNLGSGFQVGHSYFCGNGQPLTAERYLEIVRHEILPLLKEYWIDDPDTVKSWRNTLQASIPND